jgi:hypothetical protein
MGLIGDSTFKLPAIKIKSSFAEMVNCMVNVLKPRRDHWQSLLPPVKA